ncbi:MAG: double-strand break repair helicase AddA [Pseudomonadota bacterium]
MRPPLGTRETQRRAADPNRSVWVSANAGSGKTYVLSRRVVRLLLAGADPAKVLCITFTKAAAAEMEARVFGVLAGWTSMPDVELSEAITELTGQAPSEAEMRRARRLFAIAVETPGRLKIQTIHAFCERVLQLFPFEGGIPHGFSVLDERASAELLREAEAQVLSEIDAQPGGHLAQALDRLAAAASDYGTLFAARLLIGARAEIAAWRRMAELRHGSASLALKALLGLSTTDSLDGCLAEILDGPHLPRRDWPEIAARLRALTTATPQDQAEKLQRASAAIDPEDSADLYLGLFFTDSGTLRKRLAVKEITAAEPDISDSLLREADRLPALRNTLKALRLWQANDALIALAGAILDRYEASKRVRGALDFDDLIDKTVALLDLRDAADWVLYKLDQGLDHILVDEAQDTSPAQWQVIVRLTEEFFAGQGARETNRTLFAVGDPKQSIYSFQGAAPGAFEAIRRRYQRALSGDLGLERLDLSFRSVPLLLNAVDRVFTNSDVPAGKGLGQPEDYIPHTALRRDAPGRVDFWPTEIAEETEDAPAWDAPLDTPQLTAPHQRLAVRIANQIAAWLRDGTRLAGRDRVIAPKDILILLRKRAPLAGPLIRALKDRGVPVSGADRLNVTGHIAVQDLVALADWCLLRDDDLSLAAVLKSPLIDLSEEALFALAHNRGSRSLADALDQRSDDVQGAEAARTRLENWRLQADRSRPFEFFAGVLDRDAVAATYRALYGGEVEDAFAAFLQMALDYERLHPPTLRGFLTWLAAGSVELKRDMEQPDETGPGVVRIMTVHGAKGLEAPIVILPDTCTTPEERSASTLFRIEGGDIFAPPEGFVWVPRKDMDTDRVVQLRSARAEHSQDEYHRLLYVAMTRAEDWLIVTGFEPKRGRHEGCWYDLIGSSLADDLEDTPDGTEDWPVRTYRSEGLPHAGIAAGVTAVSDAPDETPPDWLFRPHPLVPRPTLVASAVDQDMGLRPVVGRSAPVSGARLFGTVLHDLLEHLPGVDQTIRREAGLTRIDRVAGDIQDSERITLVDTALRLVADPMLAPLFGPGSRAEVEISGRLDLEDGRSVTAAGRVDRLVIGDDIIDIIDFKSSLHPPDAVEAMPEAVLDQLSLYRALVTRAFPGYTVRCAILWTALPRLDVLPSRMTAPSRVTARALDALDRAP